jgi:hypothetical protein
MSDASGASQPTSAEGNHEEHAKYVAEFVDGPLEGTADHRYLVDGQPEQELTQMGLVEGTEVILWYRAQDSRDVGGVLHARYGFDRDDSDTLPGQADQDARSIEL